MWAVNLLGVIIMAVSMGTGQEDSLRGALNAINKRQRDLTEIPEYEDVYAERGLAKYYAPPENKEDLAFLKPENRAEYKAFERALLDYLDENGNESFNPESFNRDGLKKHFSSLFRERIEKDKAKQREELADRIYNKVDENPEAIEDNEKYMDLIQQLYEKYRDSYFDRNLANPEPKEYALAETKKRVFPSEYYTNLGYESAGLKKKSRYFEPDGPSESLYLLNYTPRDEFYDKLQEEDLEASDPGPDYYKWNLNQRWNEQRKRNKLYSRPLYIRKRFPVTKRSSPPLHYEPRKPHQHKRASHKAARNPAATDPKVAKALSTVFGVANSKSPIEDKPKKSVAKKSEKPVKPTKTEHDFESDKKPNKAADTAPAEEKKEDKDDNKRDVSNEVTSNSADKEKSLNIKKKSIDWSDYFGYDRKKKTEDGMDKDWMMERFHQAIAMTTKRSADYPLEEFRNHDEVEIEKASNANKVKLDDMESKLRTIEDTIVEDTLKYAGAHEGIEDTKEIQDMKDKMITRLAAAYSLEKMRQALGEYKESIAKQRKELEESGKLDDPTFSEDKRVSVPRKQAIDEEREKTPEGDNEIKCSQGDEDCEEQTYNTPSEVLEEESRYDKGACPKVQRACNEVANVLGNFGRVLEPACNMHQACLLCGENSWFAPTRQCNILFLTKADELCDGDLDCQRISRHSVRYLLDINRSLRTEPSDECDLICPDK